MNAEDVEWEYVAKSFLKRSGTCAPPLVEQTDPAKATTCAATTPGSDPQALLKAATGYGKEALKGEIIHWERWDCQEMK